MTRYFMRNTPYFSAEIMMMTVPGFKPKGRGYLNTFKYKAKDVECEFCLHYDRKHPCKITECVCLEERAEAGVLTPEELAEAYLTLMGQPRVMERMKFHCLKNEFKLFEDPSHKRRWDIWHSYNYDSSNRTKAAVYLLSSHSELWRRIIWNTRNGEIDFGLVNLSGIPENLYCVYQAAKTIATGCKKITYGDIASPEIVSDTAFRLIIISLLISQFGDCVVEMK